MKGIRLILLLIGSYAQCFAQKDMLVFQPVNNPVLQQYTIRDINAGRDGKLWLSTDNGLLCFDGNDVKVFQHKNGDAYSLTSNDIARTYSDSRGNLYITTYSNVDQVASHNIDYMDVKTGRVAPLQNMLILKDYIRMASPSAFSEMFFDNDDTFWEGIYNVGFFHYNLKTKRAVPYYLHKDSTSARTSVYVIKQDSTNSELLWLATEDGIFSFNKKTKELKRNFRDTNPLDSSAADLNVTKMDLINRDTIWFSVPGRGFGSYNLRTGFYTMYPWINKKEKNATPIDILTMQRKSKNEYYIATEHNLPGIFNTYTHHYDFT